VLLTVLLDIIRILKPNNVLNVKIIVLLVLVLLSVRIVVMDSSWKMVYVLLPVKTDSSVIPSLRSVFLVMLLVPLVVDKVSINVLPVQ